MLYRGEASKEPRRAFHWFRDDEAQVAYWLRPFVCHSARSGLEQPAPKSGLLSGHLLPSELESLVSYAQADPKRGLAFEGLAGLLANVFEHHLKDLQHQPRKTQSEQVAEWSLTTSDTIIEFSFQANLDDEGKRRQLGIDDFVGLQVTVSKEHLAEEERRTVTVVSQITVLKAEDEFADTVLQIPQGYSCRRTIALPFNMYGSSPMVASNNGRTKYTLQAIASLADDYDSWAAQVPPSLDLFSMLNPMEAMHRPQSSSSQITLLLDILDRTVSIVSTKENQHESTLIVWDFKTKRKQVVERSKLARSSCREAAEAFQSSLFEASFRNETKPSNAVCAKEQVEVKLANGFSIRLNDAGLKLLTLSLQNKQNNAQLIDAIQTSEADWDLTYEMPAHDIFCMDLSTSDDHDFELPYNSVRLVTKYSYSLKSNAWLAESSSLLVFDRAQTKLMIAIQLYMLHVEPYKPWSNSQHLLDLSACKSGPGESARVRIEYPLTRESVHMKQVEAPHEMIRSALANYLLLSYSISLARIPSIEVRILDDLVQVDIRLLDRWDLLSDSEHLDTVRGVKEDEYLAWLRGATRSVLADSGSRCAQYCQHYQCTQYVFCRRSLACYLFNSANWSNKLSGSYQSASLHCDAFNVLSSRLEQGGLWRKASWSLEEILESLVESCKQQSDDYEQYGSFTWLNAKKTGDQVEDSMRFARVEVMQPSLKISATFDTDTGKPSSRLISLYPAFAHYSYERPQAGAFAEPADGADDETQMRPSEPSLAEFDIAFSGFQFVDRSSVVPHGSEATNDRGLVTLRGHQLNECTRHCLADTSCFSFSYCSGLGTCILTNLSRAEVASRLESPAGRLNSDLAVKKADRCSIAVRTFSGQFERFERRDMAASHAGRPMTEVVDVFKAASGEECATSCALNRAGGLQKSSDGVDPGKLLDTCLSYDFCRAAGDAQTASCVLFRRRLVTKTDLLTSSLGLTDEPELGHSNKESTESGLLLDVLKRELKMEEASVCWHYVRNFLSDFIRINNRRLADDMKALVLKNYDANQSTDPERGDPDEPSGIGDDIGVTGDGISLVHCARLCEENPDCGAFEYCAASHKAAPSGLYLSCSLGVSATLEMAPPVAVRAGRQEATPARKQQRAELALLSKSRICSVYTYKSLSLILRGKKKNLDKLGSELLDEAAERAQSWWPSLVRLDLLVLLAFFLLGLVVRDLGLDQFGFRRLAGMNDRGGSAQHSSSNQNVPKPIALQRHQNPSAGDEHLQLDTLGPV